MNDEIDETGTWAEPHLFRCWAAMLVRTSGLHWRIVAAMAGISPTAMSHLLWGRSGRPISRLHVATAAALMDLAPEDIRRADRTRVPASWTRGLLDGLHHLGWTEPQLATWLTRSDMRLATSRAAFYCTRLTAARVQACYDYLTSSATPRAAAPDTAA